MTIFERMRRSLLCNRIDHADATSESYVRVLAAAFYLGAEEFREFMADPDVCYERRLAGRHDYAFRGVPVFQVMVKNHFGVAYP